MGALADPTQTPAKRSLPKPGQGLIKKGQKEQTRERHQEGKLLHDRFLIAPPAHASVELQDRQGGIKSRQTDRVRIKV